MHNPTSLKREFLKKWMMNLRTYKTSSAENMTVAERKTAIKRSADIALASSRNRATRWSRGVIANASSVEQIISSSKITRISWSRIRGKIVKRSRRVRRTTARRKCSAKRVAEKLVERKTRVLRGLVPGGELMDEVWLIEEALDYMSALQAQVDVMRCVLHYHHEHTL